VSAVSAGRAGAEAFPAWRRDADVVVVGSGAAGISVALTAAARGLRVLVVTKDLVGGSTPLAQGGLAAALGAGDTPAAHVADTLTAGAGLCEPGVVTALADSAPGAIDWLTGLGAQLETRQLRLEGGHSARRIVHSGNDATGAEVHRALLAALLRSEIEILDRTVALDLLVTGHSVSGGSVTGGSVTDRPVTGLAAAFIGADGSLSPGEITARAVVVAAGGLGQVFATTTNPAGATGDGIAIAARAGAVVRDLEFVQFHPTVLWLPGASGQCPLITEALRGAGAVLRDLDGTPLMAGHDQRGDLAPRDVVAARMAAVIAAGTAGHVWLDATGLDATGLVDGFPTVTAACRKHGIDPVTEYIPVAPGAHYSCGGILADLDGRTTLVGLYAVGEAASTGVQGANRLASNSVTEAVIAGRRAGHAIAGALAGDAGSGAILTGLALTEPALTEPALTERAGRGVGAAAVPGSDSVARRLELADAMSRWAGVMRDAEGLDRLVQLIAGEAGGGDREEAALVMERVDLDLDAVEAANLRTVSWLIAVGARRRVESRGCHRRRDAVGTAERAWHTLLRWNGQGWNGQGWNGRGWNGQGWNGHELVVREEEL
jgi:L-aspartate oxidase